VDWPVFLPRSEVEQTPNRLSLVAAVRALSEYLTVHSMYQVGPAIAALLHSHLRMHWRNCTLKQLCSKRLCPVEHPSDHRSAAPTATIRLFALLLSPNPAGRLNSTWGARFTAQRMHLSAPPPPVFAHAQCCRDSFALFWSGLTPALLLSSQWISRLVATNGPNERGRHQLSGDYGGTEPPGIRFIHAAKGYPSRKLA
jgi:hypothetical protein